MKMVLSVQPAIKTHMSELCGTQYPTAYDQSDNDCQNKYGDFNLSGINPCSAMGVMTAYGAVCGEMSKTQRLDIFIPAVCTAHFSSSGIKLPFFAVI